jgi:hypothetical protein
VFSKFTQVKHDNFWLVVSQEQKPQDLIGGRFVQVIQSVGALARSAIWPIASVAFQRPLALNLTGSGRIISLPPLVSPLVKERNCPINCFRFQLATTNGSDSREPINVSGYCEVVVRLITIMNVPS